MPLVILILGFAFLAQAQPMAPQALAEYVKANYTKFEHRVPMRDGKYLFTSIYVPKDDSRTYPFLLSRTPYSCAPYGADKYRPNLGPNELFAKSGYIFVCQDVRGRYLSEGEFIEMTPHKSVKRGPADFDESSDTYDSIDWLLKNIKGNNGKAGIIGISYPALKTASPHAPVIDLFLGGDAYHNGAFVLAANFGFCTCFGKKKTEPELPDANARHFAFASRDGYDFYKRFGPLAYADEKYFKRESAYWTDLLAHTAYDDFWKSRNLTQHVKNISPAVLTVRGLFDAEDLQGPLRLDAALEKQSPATRHTSLWASGCMMAECGVMETSLAASLSISRPFHAFTKKVEFPCFEFHLNGKPDPKLSRAIIFETGSNRCGNFDAWPPRARRKISISTPTANSALRLPRKPKVPLNS